MPKSRFAGVAIVAMILLAAITVSAALKGGQSQDQRTSSILTEDGAARLLNQIAEGLQGHSSNKILNAFDLPRMDGGATFKAQITAFLNQYETIRVHFKLVEVKDGTAIVNAELDATPRDSLTPPEHTRLQLTFSADNGSGGWKFVDVQPRGFFS